MVYLLVSLPRSQAFHPWGSLAFFDLHVYRGAGHLVLTGRSVYSGPIWQWAPFTYPPFAAVVLTPLALVPFGVDAVLVTAFGFVVVFVILSLALRLPSGNGWRPEPGRPWASPLTPLAVAAALWLEPITSTLGYGQINLLIALLVVGDLSRPDGSRGTGALIGLAAGLKLTPLIFVPYLLFSRRRRAAGVALGTFAATIAAGFAVLPGDSQRFWTGRLFLDPGRVGGSYVPANQSLRGLILRLDPSFGSGRLLAIAMIVATVGVALAVLASRRGDEAMGFSLCALTGLLVSPVSWTHHWAIAVPVLLLAGVRAVRRGSRAGIAAVAMTLLVGFSYLPKLMAKPTFAPSGGHSVAWTLAAAPYVWIGVLALAAAAAYETRPCRWRALDERARRLAQLLPTRNRSQAERNQMRRLLWLLSLSALFAAVLAACGSSQSRTVPSLGGATNTQAAAPGSLAAARAAVDCARKHGMPGISDPVLGANGQVTFPGGTPTPTPEVASACAPQIRAAEASSSTLPNVSATDMQALLRWAACIRAHGLPRWPDPNAQGVFHVKSADAGTLVTNKRANAACQSLRGGTLAREDITPSGQ